jgi:hypothetical protein
MAALRAVERRGRHRESVSMRWQWQVSVVFTALGVAVPARVAAQGATTRSTDVARDGTNPKPNQPSVAITFDESAAALPQTDIRAAIAEELGTSPDRTVVAAPRALSIGVEANELVVRLSSPDGRAERRVALPSDAAQITDVLRFIAGNLARDQRVLLEPTANEAPAEPARGASVTAVAEPRAEAPKRTFRRHWFGLHVAQDFLYSPWSAVCDVGGGVDTTYSCYHAGTSHPYVPNSNSTFRNVQSVMMLATTRILASYDYALAPYFTLGGRVGVALRGAPSGDGPTPYGGLSDKRFFPLHLEARATWWFLPLTNERVRAFVGAGAGMMQMDARAKVDGVCGLDTAGGATTDGCSQPSGSTPAAPVTVEAWKQVGRGFVDVRVGMEVRVWDELGLELDVHGIAAFPAVGYALEPSFGVVYGL